MEQVIRRSAALHLQHIATGGDPFEHGSSRPLDFGHWAAHKLEQMTESPAAAMARRSASASRSTAPTRISPGSSPRPSGGASSTCSSRSGCPVYTPALDERLDTPDDPGCMLRGLAEFQEHLGGRLTIMLLKGIGQPFDVHEIRTDVMIRRASTS